jgi:hypothetical protein
VKGTYLDYQIEAVLFTLPGDLLPNSEVPTNTIVSKDTTMSPSMKPTTLLLDSRTLTYIVVTDLTERCPLVPTTADFLMLFAANPQKVLIPAFFLGVTPQKMTR